MKHLRKVWLLALALGLSQASWAQQAQKCPKHSAQSEQFKAQKQAHKAEREALQQQFWAGLSSKEQAFLREKQAEFKSLKAQKQAHHQAVHAYFKEHGKGSELPASLQTKKEELHTKFLALHNDLETFYQRNSNLVSETKDKLKALHEQRQAERQALKEEAKKQGKGHHRGHGRHGRHGHKHHEHALTRFDRFVLNADGEAQTQAVANPAEAFNSLSLFPNPVTNNVLHLKFELNQDLQKLSLRIVDEQGKVLGHYPLGAVKAGAQQVDWALPDLPKGRHYLLQVFEDAQLLRAEKFMKM